MRLHHSLPPLPEEVTHSNVKCMVQFPGHPGVRGLGWAGRLAGYSNAVCRSHRGFPEASHLARDHASSPAPRRRERGRAHEAFTQHIMWMIIVDSQTFFVIKNVAFHGLMK